jgi:hypothetical protein
MSNYIFRKAQSEIPFVLQKVIINVIVGETYTVYVG